MTHRYSNLIYMKYNAVLHFRILLSHALMDKMRLKTHCLPGLSLVYLL